MKRTFIGIVLLCLFFPSHGQTKHVLYGERDLATDTACVYLDRNGFVYPSVQIPNNELTQVDCSLKEWYRQHEKRFIQIAAGYNCMFTKFSESDCLILNDSIIQSITRRLNSTPNPSFTFLVHGYRKPFSSINGDTGSPDDFKTLIGVYNQFGDPASKTVEVYWDALYGCCFSANSKKNKVLFELFEEAQKNAEPTGNALKKIIAGSSKDVVNIVTHSLGAKVAMYALLNISNTSAPTPSNHRVNICLIAPAISPELIADNYLKRNPQINTSLADNYHLYIVYNENDFVLKKKDNVLGLLGPGPFKYGNTTLGCNWDHAATRLENKFNSAFKMSPFKLYDLSFVGKCHLVSCYCFAQNLLPVFTDMKN